MLAAAAERAEADGLDGPEGAILAAVEELGALGKVAHRFGVSRAAVQAWIRTDPERLRPLIAEARLGAGDGAAEEAGEILDVLAKQSELTTAEVSLANSRANHRKWLAGVWNEMYRDRRGAEVKVEVDVRLLHLEALRAEGVRRNPVVVATVVEGTPEEEDGGAQVEQATWEEED